MSRRTGAAGAIGIAAAAIGLLAGAVGTIAAVVTVAMARRVVIPPTTKPEDERILAVDLASGEVVLAASDETRMRGRYGFWFDHESGHARLGDVVDEGDRFVRRDSTRSTSAASSAPTEDASTAGTTWGHGSSATSTRTSSSRRRSARRRRGSFRPRSRRPGGIIQVHGRGAKRHEGLRAVDPAQGCRVEHAPHLLPQRR
jgi:hypothetical protein